MKKLINNYYSLLLVVTLLFPLLGFTQESTKVLNQVVKGFDVETGYFYNGQPYTKVGTGDKILIHIEALSFDHKPLDGFLLKLFVQQNMEFYKEYSVYQIGRKPNLIEGYSIDDMANDYGVLITNQFKTKVNVVGVSTGGQIGLSLAASFPDVINKVVIISAAYRLNEKGKELEKQAAKYFAQEKYGKTMSTLLEAVYDKGFKLSMYKAMMRMMGRSLLKDIECPNDFQVTVKADCEMDFKERLNEIRVSTLIISGKRDIGYSIADVRTTAAGLENSKLIVYEKYGHDLYPDNYKEVNENILEFFHK
ncbi:MAG: alpha/beta fold hydrolase [Crocinitomicaceae bacterium]